MTNISITNKISEANAITHGGYFHADEVFATIILSKVVKTLTVLRSFQVPQNINDDIIVYDIGNGKFDHHQKGGNGIRENGVPYSSCGLIWKEFGQQIVAQYPNPELVWEIVDRELIQGIDAIDNGTLPKLNYPARIMSISAAISSYNPTWDSSKDSDKCFLTAIEFANSIFENVLESAVSKSKAKNLVEVTIEEPYHENILILHRFMPWQEYLLTSQNPKAEKIQFVIFPSNRGGFNLHCVPTTLGGKDYRKSIPIEWHGLSGTKLQNVTGVSTATFCHPAGFIAGASTLSGAIKMAEAINQ